VVKDLAAEVNAKPFTLGTLMGLKYHMEEGFTRKELEAVQEERDLGIIITADLKSSSQCIKSAATARRVIEIVRRNFKHLDIDDFRLVRPIFGHN